MHVEFFMLCTHPAGSLVSSSLLETSSRRIGDSQLAPSDSEGVWRLAIDLRPTQGVFLPRVEDGLWIHQERDKNQALTEDKWGVIQCHYLDVGVQKLKNQLE